MIPGQQGRSFGGVQRYELRHPIVWKDKKITIVQLRWPTVEQLQRVNRLRASAEHSLKFIALITGLPQPAVEMLDFEDVDRLKDSIAKFVGYR